MIESINNLTGTDDCSEAILAQERPSWTVWVIAPLAIVLGFLAGAFTNLGTIFVGAIVGGIIGIGFAMTTDYWVLARCGADVVLARSSKLSAKAVEVVERWPAPVESEDKKGLIQSKVTVPGHTLMIARQFTKRFAAIVR